MDSGAGWLAGPGEACYHTAPADGAGSFRILPLGRTAGSPTPAAPLLLEIGVGAGGSIPAPPLP